jgi:hypothetical protein
VERLFTAFVSSTYQDLRSERQLVAHTLLDQSCVPLGMEFFPASGLTPWEVIKRTIGNSDFAVLLVAGRYGSLWRNNKSWTEREYDEFRRAGKKVVALLHRDWRELPHSKCESDPKLVAALEAFRVRVERDFTTRYWHDEASLVSGLSASVQHLITGSDLPGWTRHPLTQSGHPINFESLRRSGLLELQLDFYKNVQWADLFSKAEEVDLFFTYARSWRRQLTGELTAFARRAKRFRVLLPSTKAGQDTALLDIARRAGESPAQVAKFIDETADYYRALGAAVWACDHTQLFTSYRIGDVLIAAMYNHRRGQSPNLPVIVCEAGGELYDFFAQDFQYILDNYAYPL